MIVYDENLTEKKIFLSLLKLYCFFGKQFCFSWKKFKKVVPYLPFFKVVTSVVLLFTFELSSFSYSND